jgi:hypothetical protein
MNNETSETENQLPSATTQIAGAIGGVAIVIIGLRTVVAVKRARTTRAKKIALGEDAKKELKNLIKSN